MLDNHLRLENQHYLNQVLMHVEEEYHFDEEFEDFFHTKKMNFNHKNSIFFILFHTTRATT